HSLPFAQKSPTRRNREQIIARGDGHIEPSLAVEFGKESLPAEKFHERPLTFSDADARVQRLAAARVRHGPLNASRKVQIAEISNRGRACRDLDGNPLALRIIPGG